MEAVSAVSNGHEVEVLAKAKRRVFAAQYKQRILREADACTKLGELGALLRREGLYSSHLVNWRAARRRGELAGLTGKRGPAKKPVDPAASRIAELERELRRAEARAERAEALLAFKKKVEELLGITLPPYPPEKS